MPRKYSLVASHFRALKALIAFLLVACATGRHLLAQNANQTIWTRDSIHSSILGETRFLRISLPAFYNAAWNAPERFPVLIALDADMDLVFTASAASVRIMAEGLNAGTPTIPPLIIVGVETPNPGRFHDLTPPPIRPFVPLDGFRAPGGAPAFLRFLSEELRPYIAARYRTNSSTFLAGHSLSGSFAAWAFGHAPDFLSGVIALSPTPGWLTEDTLAGRQVIDGIAARSKPGRLFLASGSAEHYLGSGVQSFAAALHPRSASGVVFEYAKIPDAAHGQVAFLGMIPGLRYIFRPVSLASYQLEFEDGEDRLAKFSAMFDSTRNAFVTGARQLGLPERLPFSFLGLQARGMTDATLAPLQLRLCQEMVASYPTLWNGHDCAGDALARLRRASEAAASHGRAIEAARSVGDSATADRLTRKAASRP